MKKKGLQKLFVKAVPSANVPEISAEGEFVSGHGQIRRIVGKVFNNETEEWDIIEPGVFICYHPENIKHLKEKSLIAMNIETALLAGVSL